MDLGGLETVAGALTQQSLFIPPGQTKRWTVIYILHVSPLDVSPLEQMIFELSCDLLYKGNKIFARSSHVRLEIPKPLTIGVEPTFSEIGIGEVITLQVKVQDDSGTPIPGQRIDVTIDSQEVITVTNVLTQTNDIGAGTLRIRGQRMGQARVSVEAADGRGTNAATITVWPLLRAPARTGDGRQGANIRREPISSSESITVPRTEPFKIIGRNVDGTWLQIRLPDGGTGWVYRGGVGVEVLHEAEIQNLPIMVPFYRVGMADPRGIFLYLPTSLKAVRNIKPELQETPPEGYTLVEVSFWVPEKLVIEQDGIIKLKTVTNATEWACWQVPQSDPTTETSNCGQLSKRTETMDVSSSQLIINDWRQVTLKAWIKTENLR